MLDSARSRPAHIMALANQKGGVGKTTTAINLAASLVERGFRVLVVDIDPQGNASTGLGLYPQDRTLTSYDVLLEAANPSEAVVETDYNGLYLIPSTTDLSAADIRIYGTEKRSYLLKEALHASEMSALKLDFILIDCPPSLNLLTLNALGAAHSVLVPLQTEFFALEGLSQLLVSIREVRETSNPTLRVEGIVLTMFDTRNALSRQVEEDARENLGELVMKTVIPRNVRLSEAASYGTPALRYDTASKGASAYRALAMEIIENQSVMTGGAQ